MNIFLMTMVFCTSIIGLVSPMKRSCDFGTLLSVGDDVAKIIVCHLDIESFLALQQVYNKHLYNICNGIPLNYLGFTFCDAADCGNKKLIDRFIKQCDTWMFEQEMSQEVFISQEDDESTTIKIAKHAFSSQLQKLLGNCSFYCVSENDNIVRYAWFWNDPEMLYGQVESGPKSHCVIYLNVDGNCQEANEALVKCLKDAGSKTFYKAHSYSRKAGYCNCFYIDYSVKFGIGKSEDFRVGAESDSVASILKAFGMMTIFFMAAQTNNAAVLKAILNNTEAADCLPYEFLRIAANVPTDPEIKQIIEVVRDEKTPFHVTMNRPIRADAFRLIVQRQNNNYMF